MCFLHLSNQIRFGWVLHSIWYWGIFWAHSSASYQKRAFRAQPGLSIFYDFMNCISSQHTVVFSE